jgi:hypothetical protein
MIGHRVSVDLAVVARQRRQIDGAVARLEAERRPEQLVQVSNLALPSWGEGRTKRERGKNYGYS